MIEGQETKQMGRVERNEGMRTGRTDGGTPQARRLPEAAAPAARTSAGSSPGRAGPGPPATTARCTARTQAAAQHLPAGAASAPPPAPAPHDPARKQNYAD